MSPLFLLILLAGGWIAWQWYRDAEAEKRAALHRKLLLYGAIGLAALLLLSDRLNPIFAAAAALIPLGQRLLSATGTWRARFAAGTGARGPHAGATYVRSRYLRVVMDAATGALSGEVLSGDFAGRALDSLSRAEVAHLLARYRREDPESAALLEAYLGSGARGTEHARHDRPANGPPVGGMEPDEAYAILGLARGAPREEIIAAHRRLMQRFHPDRGGSNYLAAKINQAKDTLSRS